MQGSATRRRPLLPRPSRAASWLALAGIAVTAGTAALPATASAQVVGPGGPDDAVLKQFNVPVGSTNRTVRDRTGRTIRVTRRSGSQVVVPGSQVIRRTASTITAAAGPTVEGLPELGLLPLTVSESGTSGTLYTGASCSLEMLTDVSWMPAQARTSAALAAYVGERNRQWTFGPTPTPLPDAVLSSFHTPIVVSGKQYISFLMVVKGSCDANGINAAVSGQGLFRDEAKRPVTTASWTSFWNRLGEHFSKALIAELAGYVATAAIASAVAFAAPELYASAPNTVLALSGCFGGFVTEIIKKVWVDKNWAWADALSSCAIKAFVSVGLKNIFEEVGKNMIPALAQGATRGWSAIHGSRFGRFIGDSLARVGPWVRQRYGVASVSVTSMLPDVESNLDSRWAFVQDPVVHACLEIVRLDVNPDAPLAWPETCRERRGW